MANGLLKTGIIGTVVAVVCCFTPVLAILLSTLGLATIVGYLDYVLIPVLVIFLGILVFGVLKGRKT